ncbi:metal-dependent transcriptional regulator [Promineifilum sp.]|uniref:metal-dependent transcriptional regulator n=1 Tax=Promineifilum sp. TaxID=2664178 RepID=UPI0031CCA3EB
MKHDSFNESAEMYLKTVSELAEGGAPVPISALADRLGVSPVSATEMIHRLQGNGLVAHRPYKGILLTDDGHRRAADVIRSHRLWECFLVDHLGLPWNEVHDLACRLEHASDRQVTDALDGFLGCPATCPHGNPIPPADGWSAETANRSLAELHPGDKAVVVNIHPETGELLSYLADLGLRPGSRMAVVDVVPFGGPIILNVQGEQRYLGQEAAAFVFIHVIEEMA